MLAGQRVLITKFDHDPSRAVGSARHKRCSWPIGARQEQWLRAYPQATAAQAATLAPRPPFNARVETVTTKPFFREPFTPNGGLVVQSGARSLRHRDAIISLAARYKLPAVNWSGILLRRRSLPSRTRDCSMNYASHYSSRRRPPTCSRSLVAR